MWSFPDFFSIDFVCVAPADHSLLNQEEYAQHMTFADRVLHIEGKWLF